MNYHYGACRGYHCVSMKHLATRYISLTHTGILLPTVPCCTIVTLLWMSSARARGLIVLAGSAKLARLFYSIGHGAPGTGHGGKGREEKANT